MKQKNQMLNRVQARLTGFFFLITLSIIVTVEHAHATNRKPPTDDPECTALASTTPESTDEIPKGTEKNIRTALKSFEKILEASQQVRANYAWDPHHEDIAIKHMEYREAVEELEALLKLKITYAEYWLISHGYSNQLKSRAEMKVRLLYLQAEIERIREFLEMRIYSISLHKAHMELPILGGPATETDPEVFETAHITDTPGNRVEVMGSAHSRYRIRSTNIKMHLRMLDENADPAVIVLTKLKGLKLSQPPAPALPQ